MRLSALAAPVSCALVCLRTGNVLEMLDGPRVERLSDLAYAAAALLGEPVPEALAAAFVRLGSERAEPSFPELSFVSCEGAHALQRLPAHVALVGVCADPERLSSVLSVMRARRAALETSS